MAQNWYTIAGTTTASVALKTQIPNMLESLRSLHSGSSAPSSTTPRMLWADTAEKVVKQLDAGGSAWSVFGPLGGNAGRMVITFTLGGIAAGTVQLGYAPAPFVVERVVILANTTTSSSSGNEYQWTLTNVSTAGALFSGTVGTFTTLGGVGGGEITADEVYTLTPDQNETLEQDNVLTFSIASVGAPTAVSQAVLFLQGYEVGP